MDANENSYCETLPTSFPKIFYFNNDVIITTAPQTSATLFHQLINDQESEESMLLSLHLVKAIIEDDALNLFLSPSHNKIDDFGAIEEIEQLKNAIARKYSEVIARDETALTTLMTYRAPFDLLEGCWLDLISQPATQPAHLVNSLFAFYATLQGTRNDYKTLLAERMHYFEKMGVLLPDIRAKEFSDDSRIGLKPLLFTAFLISLSRYTRTYLPELMGFNFGFYELATSYLLRNADVSSYKSDCRATLDLYLNGFAGDGDDAKNEIRQRVSCGIRLAIAFETLLFEEGFAFAEQHANDSLNRRVENIFSKYAPYAKQQHKNIKVQNERLVDIFNDEKFCPATFAERFKESPFVKPKDGGQSRFMEALKFNGSMFGIFTQDESTLLRSWAENGLPHIHENPSQSIEQIRSDSLIKMLRLNDRDPIACTVQYHVEQLSPRQFFHTLVNVENFPSVRKKAYETAKMGFEGAQRFLKNGRTAKYSDATYFDYSPQALDERIASIYTEKLLAPYVPLDVIPSQEEVIFIQKCTALNNLLDGTWLHRIGKAGRGIRFADSRLFHIYADEMGFGELRKNHLVVLNKVLSSMSVNYPHIVSPEFIESYDMMDELFYCANYVLSIALFPDTFYAEILGLNLAIELFGLGEFRLHEIQKMKHWGFDPSFEKLHLTIDNVVSGHVKMSADIIKAYLHNIRCETDEQHMQIIWSRIWTGYASLAQFVEFG